MGQACYRIKSDDGTSLGWVVKENSFNSDNPGVTVCEMNGKLPSVYDSESENGVGLMYTTYSDRFVVNYEEDVALQAANVYQDLCPPIGYAASSWSSTWSQGLHQQCVCTGCGTAWNEGEEECVPDLTEQFAFARDYPYWRYCTMSCQQPCHTLTGCEINMAYLMNDAATTNLCSSKNGETNPMFYLSFGGALSNQAVFYVYAILLLLLIIWNVINSISICKQRRRGVAAKYDFKAGKDERKVLKMNEQATDDEML